MKKEQRHVTSIPAPGVTDEEYDRLQREFDLLRETTLEEHVGHSINVKKAEVKREIQRSFSKERFVETLIQIMNHLGGFWGSESIRLPETPDKQKKSRRE